MMGPRYEPAQRRPVAIREWATSRRVARWLAARQISPNLISIVGMVCGVGAGAVLVATSHTAGPAARVAWLGAAALLQLRLLANVFDGMVAVERERASPLGELYNEVPDRISDAAILIGLGYAAGGAVVLGYVAACVALLVAYVRAMGGLVGARQEFCGPMAKPHRMGVVTLVALYAGLTPAAWQPGVGGAAEWGVAAGGLIVIIVGGVWTTARRLRRTARALRESNS